MKTRRQEDGRRLGNDRQEMDTYACDELPTGLYVPLSMCQLCCTVCTFQHASWYLNTKRLLFWGFVHSVCGVMPQNRQLMALQKRTLQGQHAFIILPSKRYQCCWLKASDIKEVCLYHSLWNLSSTKSWHHACSDLYSSKQSVWSQSTWFKSQFHQL